MAQHGAARVVGLDIRENVLEKAKQAAETVGLSSKCSFCQETKTKADVVVSLDSFEHFQDPNRVLCQMAGLLQPGGQSGSHGDILGIIHLAGIRSPYSLGPT